MASTSFTVLPTQRSSMRKVRASTSRRAVSGSDLPSPPAPNSGPISAQASFSERPQKRGAIWECMWMVVITPMS